VKGISSEEESLKAQQSRHEFWKCGVTSGDIDFVAATNINPMQKKHFSTSYRVVCFILNEE